MQYVNQHKPRWSPAYAQRCESLESNSCKCKGGALSEAAGNAKHAQMQQWVGLIGGCQRRMEPGLQKMMIGIVDRRNHGGRGTKLYLSNNRWSIPERKPGLKKQTLCPLYERSRDELNAANMEVNRALMDGEFKCMLYRDWRRSWVPPPLTALECRGAIRRSRPTYRHISSSGPKTRQRETHDLSNTHCIASPATGASHVDR